MKKKQNIFVVVILLLLVGSVVLYKTKSSFSLPENNSVSISCDSTSLTSGGSTTCSIVGSSTAVEGVEGRLSTSGGLTITEINPEAGWNYTDSSNNYLTYMTTTAKSGSFKIAKVKVKAPTVTSNVTGSLVFGDIKFNGAGSAVNVNSASRSITINKNKSTVNTLKSLVVGGKSLNTSVNTHSLTINAATTSISATAPDYGSVSGTGTKSLKYGVNTFKVYSKSESGSTRTYTINITRKDTRDGNNNLSSLSINHGKINFSASKTNYSVTVDKDVASVKVSAKLASSKSAYVRGYNPRTVKLNYGTNNIQIKVIAENQKVKVYTVSVVRPKKAGDTKKSDSKSDSTSKSSKDNKKKSSDNKLKTLVLSKGTILFDSDKLSYDVEVPNKVDSIEISGDPSNDKAKVEGLGKRKLQVGSNVIKVVVTAENGDEKTYTLRITRKEESNDKNLDTNNYLKDLSIEGYEFNFDKNTLNYEIKRNGNNSLNIKTVPESEKSQVAIIGNENLKDKDEIKVVVTAEAGDNRTYTITVVDDSNILTAIGIFIIGILSVAVAVAYKKRRSIVE